MFLKRGVFGWGLEIVFHDRLNVGVEATLEYKPQTGLMVYDCKPVLLLASCKLF